MIVSVPPSLSPNDAGPLAIEIRPIGAEDSIEALTALLHRSYGQLAAMGLRYLATHQSPAVTRERIAEGRCLLALRQGALVGTIVFRDAGQTKGCVWYDRDGVASFAQFAVDPEMQRFGIGLRLIGAVETFARTSGAREIALDTAEPATHLVAWYRRLGYRPVGHAQWAHTNYRSVILSKTLGEAAE